MWQSQRQLIKNMRSFLENVAGLFVVLGCGLNALVHVRQEGSLVAQSHSRFGRKGRCMGLKNRKSTCQRQDTTTRKQPTGMTCFWTSSNSGYFYFLHSSNSLLNIFDVSSLKNMNRVDAQVWENTGLTNNTYFSWAFTYYLVVFQAVLHWIMLTGQCFIHL